MKKFCALLLALAMVFSLSACGAPTSVDDIPLEELLYLFDDMTDLELGRFCIREEVTADNVNYHLGSQDFTGKFESAMALSPMMSPSAMELMVFRLAPGDDARTFAHQLKSKADPRKWVCVGAETVETATSGRTVLFFMGGKQTWNTLSQCFAEICETGFRAEDHLNDPLAGLTAEALYAQLEEQFGMDETYSYGLLDGAELLPAQESDPLGLTAQDLKGLKSSLVDQGYSEFDMERSYLLGLFRLKSGTDAAALAARLMEQADLSGLKGEGCQSIAAYSEDVVIFFAGSGSNAWYTFELNQVFQGQYRMTTIQTEP